MNENFDFWSQNHFPITDSPNLCEQNHWNFCAPFHAHVTHGASSRTRNQYVRCGRGRYALELGLCGPRGQHVRDGDGRLSAREVRVVASAADGDAEPEARHLQRERCRVSSSTYPRAGTSGHVSQSNTQPGGRTSCHVSQSASRGGGAEKRSRVTFPEGG